MNKKTSIDIMQKESATLLEMLRKVVDSLNKIIKDILKTNLSGQQSTSTRPIQLVDKRQKKTKTHNDRVHLKTIEKKSQHKVKKQKY
jgi:hypothetical protein